MLQLGRYKRAQTVCCGAVIIGDNYCKCLQYKSRLPDVRMGVRRFSRLLLNGLHRCPLYGEYDVQIYIQKCNITYINLNIYNVKHSTVQFSFMFWKSWQNFFLIYVSEYWMFSQSLLSYMAVQCDWRIVIRNLEQLLYLIHFHWLFHFELEVFYFSEQMMSSEKQIQFVPLTRLEAWFYIDCACLYLIIRHWV